jgi:hypothetical protein
MPRAQPEDALVDLSDWVWALLDRSRSAGFSPREETVTETLLIELASRFPRQVLVHKTTGWEESQIGADFAMAIETRPGVWLHLLAQAKKVQGSPPRFRELTRVTARTQAAHLISTARGAGLAAVYLLYNDSSVIQQGAAYTAGGCTRGYLTREHRDPAWTGRSPSGCMLVAADRVADLIDEGIAHQPAALADHWAPWECALCAFVGRGGRPRALNWPDHVADSGGFIDGPSDVAWLSEEPQQWASAMLQGSDPELPAGSPAATFLVTLSRQGGNPADRASGPGGQR